MCPITSADDRLAVLDETASEELGTASEQKGHRFVLLQTRAWR
jgi:hypothetical protein